MFTSVQFENYRSFQEQSAELDWFNVFIGPNGSGKSNLFYALLTLQRVVRVPLLPPPERRKEGQTEPRFPTGSDYVPFGEIVRRGDEDLRIRLRAKVKGTEGSGFYDVTFGRPNEDVVILEEACGWADDDYTWEFDSRQETLAGVRRGETRTWTVPRVYSAPTLLRPFRIESDSAPQAPAAWRLSQEISVVRYRFDPFSIKQPAEPGIVVKPNGRGLVSGLDALQKDRVRFGLLEDTFKDLFSGFEQILFLSPRPGVKQLGVRESGHELSADSMSDGALLALAILWIVFSPDPPKTVCLEEPENGVHPHLLQELVVLLRKASRGELGAPPLQILVSTHSPEFLRWCEPSEVFIVERGEEGTELMPWPEDLSKEELASRYRMAMPDAWLSGAARGVPS